MVNWVQHRGVLPTQRIEAADTVTEIAPRADDYASPNGRG